MGAQDRAAHHADQQKRQRRDDDPEIPDGEVERLARGAQQPDQERQVEPDDRAEEARRSPHRRPACWPRAALGKLLVIGPERAGDKRAPAIAMPIPKDVVKNRIAPA
jgi:hypothetical protein